MIISIKVVYLGVLRCPIGIPGWVLISKKEFIFNKICNSLIMMCLVKIKPFREEGERLVPDFKWIILIVVLKINFELLTLI